MADISRITMPSGNTYDIKDAWARTEIGKLASSTKWLGVTTTALTDGSTTNPITIGGESITASSGDIVAYISGTGSSAKTTEFIFDGTHWQEFGNVDFSTLGALAYKNSASGSYTKPSGSGTVTTTASTGAVTATESSSGSFQVGGTISTPTFTGASMTSTGSFTPAGDISLTNTNQTTTVSKASSGTATYTPSGSVSAPTISVATAGTTDTITPVSSVTVAKTVAAAAPGATAPSNPVTYTSYDSSTETLSLYQLGYTTGASVTTGTAKTFKTGDAAYTASTPTFTGDGARLVTGNISVPSSATFEGSAGSVSVSGTTTGSVSAPTFTGKKYNLSAAYDKATGVTVGTTTDTVTVS